MFIPDDLYKQILYTSIVPTLDILFLSPEGQLLLAKRKNKPLQGVYYIPGGRIHKGETQMVALARKAKEECGLEVDPFQAIFVGVYDDIFDESRYEGVDTHCIPLTYFYQLNAEEIEKINIDTQHEHFKFFDIDDNTLHPLVQLRVVDLREKGLI